MIQEGLHMNGANINEVSEILIYPNVIHSFHPLTDIIYIEYRSAVFNEKNSDVYPKSEFINGN